jgi:hypothetical protein
VLEAQKVQAVPLLAQIRLLDCLAVQVELVVLIRLQVSLQHYQVC